MLQEVMNNWEYFLYIPYRSFLREIRIFHQAFFKNEVQFSGSSENYENSKYTNNYVMGRKV